MKNKILEILKKRFEKTHPDFKDETVNVVRSYPLSIDERVVMTCSCRDSDNIPKVPDAGKVITQNGQSIQIMHEGSKVIAGGYYGDWMIRIIENLQGHHEPQEELAFHHILKHVRPGTLMVELGAFWAYYSNWYLGAVPGSAAVCVEPDENNLECGRRNLALNHREALLINACIGEQYLPSLAIRRESDQRTINVPCHNMESLLEVIDGRPIELLHIDAQGAELPFISSARSVIERGLVRFLLVSTHHESISGSPSTHQDCLREILAMGGTILAQHSVEESFSGNGLIAASFFSEDSNIVLPEISLNQAENSLFGPPPISIQEVPFISYAQNQEDVLLWRVFKEVTGGFYIDVGAAHPEWESVTKAFYDRGWKGINFEPNPHFYSMLEKERPRDINICALVGSENGERELNIVGNSGLSTASCEGVDLLKAHKHIITSRIVCKTVRLDDIIRKLGVTDIHFLKIDAEGMEKEVLKGCSFLEFRPKILVIESTIPETNILRNDGIREYLEKKGYTFVFFDGLNDYFIAIECEKMASEFNRPVNVLDKYIRAQEIYLKNNTPDPKHFHNIK